MRSKNKANQQKCTATDLVYRELKRQILSCELAPGSVLDERSVLKRLRLSRTPFREATMRLKEEGWLLSLSYRGYLIAPITFQDIADVYEMRLILETACAQIAAVRATEKHLERLGEMIRAEDRLGPHIGTNQGLVDLNFNFHLNLAEISRNARIVDTMQSLLEHVLRFDSVLTRYEPVTPWVKHAEIVAAIRNRDPLRARDKMREHVEAARQRILNAFSGHSLDLSISTFEQPRLHSGGKRPPSK